MSARPLPALLGLLALWTLAPPGRDVLADTTGFRPPTAAIRTLANGLTVAVFQDDRLPLVQLQFLLPAGSAHELVGEAGVANLTFQLLGRGTASRTAMAFDDAVQSLGGSVGGSISREFTTINGAFLAGDLEAGLELLADAVVNPVFGDETVAVLRSEIAAGIVSERQDPATLAEEHVWAAVFGQHPYGRPSRGSPRGLSAVGAAEVRTFHRNRYRPDRALLAIAGDVTPERAFKAAEELLSSWGGRTSVAPAAPAPVSGPGWRVRIVDAPGLPRVQLRLGAPGPSRSDDDHDALTVAAALPPTGVAADLRVVVAGLRDAGLVSFAASAPVDSAGELAARLRAAMVAARTSVTEATALELVRRRVSSGYLLQFETLGGTIAQWMATALRAAAADPLDGLPRRIEALTGESVRAALARRVGTDGMVLVAVGPAERLRPQLERFGPVEVIPIEAAFEVVELPSTAMAAPNPEQLAQGRALAGQAATAHGGLERLRGIKDSTLEGDIVMTPGPRELAGRMVQMRKAPDRFLYSVTIAAIRSVQGMIGTQSWSQTGTGTEGVEDLDSLGISGLRTAYQAELRHLLLAAADPKSRVAWRGRERRADRDVDVIEVVTAEGLRRLLFLDAGSHHLIAMEQGDGRHTLRRLYRDLREVNGLMWPFGEERWLDGQRTMVLTLTRVAFDTGLKDAIFLRPGSRPEASSAPGRRPRAR